MNPRKPFFKNVDWPFLIFLIGVVNVKLYVKIGIAIAYFAWLLFKKVSLPRKILSINKFYIFMPGIALFTALVQGSFKLQNYFPAFCFGVLQWFTAAFVLYLMYTRLTTNSRDKVYDTIKMFFALNALFSLAELAGLMLSSKHWMPYWYWEPTQYYFTSTGDHIKGLFGSQSLANAMINALGAVFFLYWRQMKWAMICTCIMLLCTSNVTLISFIMANLAVMIFAKPRKTKLAAILLCVFTTALYVFLSPTNIDYMQTVYKGYVKPMSTASKKEAQKNIMEIERRPGQNNFYYLNVSDTADKQYKNSFIALADYKQKNNADTKTIALSQDEIKWFMEQLYGLSPKQTILQQYHGAKKIYTFWQTIRYAESSFTDFVFGAGMGNFSSKLAIKITGLGWQGSYPERYIYISNSFLQYHFYTLMYVLSLPVSQHSVINMPNSIYNQLLGEYGIAGVLLFVFLYIGYFWKNRKQLRAGVYLFPLILFFFMFEYWFEMISLTVVFELLMLYETVSCNNTTDEKADGDGTNAVL